MKAAVEHLIIIFDMVFLAFLILDYYNAKMDFLGNSLTRKMLFGFCFINILNSIRQLALNRKKGSSARRKKGRVQ